MKKTINFFAMMLSALCVFNFNALSQNIPNPGFETWTGSGCNVTATGWGNLNSQTCLIFIGTIQKATAVGEFRSGTAGLKAITRFISFANRTAPGATVTGTFNTQTESTEGGFVYTQRPTSLIGWYRYSPQGTDNCDISVVLWRRVNGVYEEIGSGQFTRNTAANSFTQFTATINYISSATPDSAKITIVSSNSATATQLNENSTLWVDDLAFVNCTGFSVAANATNITTVGGSNGSVAAVVTGGTAAFTYLWSNNSTIATISNLSAGNYCVTATDANGCTASACANVTEPSCSGVSVSVITTDVTTNGGTDGAAEAVTAGTTDPVNYVWSPGGATTASISNLTEGIYNVTITDAVGCTATNSGAVNVPSCSGFSVNVTTETVVVAGLSQGNATATVSGGTLPYNYSWSNGVNGDEESIITNVAPGNYCVTVTDDNGCVAADCEDVLPYDCSFFSISLNITNATTQNSNDGSIEVINTGEFGLVQYNWSNNASGNLITDLAVGNYCVTATDEAGCAATDCGDVTFSVSIEEKEIAYQIFPNPAQDALFINVESNGNYIFTVFDLNGKLLNVMNFENSNNVIAVSTLTKGIYFYELKNAINGNSVKGKFLKN